MGLSNFPGPAEGVLPVLVMNTVTSVAGIKNTVRSILQVVGAAGFYSAAGSQEDEDLPAAGLGGARPRRVSITNYDSLCRNRAETSSGGGGGGGGSAVECCCVCLCRFEAKEKVSELSCKHFFHTRCLDKWFDNHHTTCPLCRSML
ncbi:PREDICTED: probable E3 ubiquitin-protein ligase XERICO [Ipomoea nil]|uniref:probable E3 ubiquitin-protein ligase XERICO n=1 Tax=Ipomoea nil TaxID=35883 RepID=UPI000900A23A|nr:PREDICTED: probable E3 ubiquitin-protein ligase XERICO [Ipomoea nil]